MTQNNETATVSAAAPSVRETARRNSQRLLWLQGLFLLAICAAFWVLWRRIQTVMLLHAHSPLPSSELRLFGWLTFSVLGLMLATFVSAVLYTVRSLARPLREQAAALLRQREALRVVDAMFSDLFEHSGEALLILDSGTQTIRRVNHHCADLTGYEPEGLVGRSFLDLIGEVQRPQAAAMLERAGKGQAVEAAELALMTRAAQRAPIELLLFPLCATGDRLTLAICRDIRERKNQEREIQNLIQQFIVLNEVGANLATTRDMKRLCTILCENLAPMIPMDHMRICLYEKETGLLRPVFDHRAPGPGETPVETGPLPDPYPAESAPVERLVARDGRYILLGSEADRVALGLDASAEGGPEVSVLVSPMMLGVDVIGLIRVSRAAPSAHTVFHLELLCNVANTAALAIRNAQLFEELSRTLDQVRDSEALLSGLVSQAPIAMWIGDIEGRTRIANELAAAMLLPQKDAPLDAGYSLLEDEPFVLQGLRADLERVGRGEIVQRELVREGRRHSLRYRATLFPLRDARRKVVHAVILFEDVTSTRALEAQLRQAQKMEAIGTLAGGIAHDFNNLLTGVLGYASYLLEHIKPDQKYHREIRLIEQSAQRAAELTRQLLAFSRKTVPRKNRMDLNDVVHETLRILQRSLRHEIELKADLAPALSPIDADATQMQQALLNLCINARDAMPQGGVLTIQTRNEKLTLAEARRIPDASPGAYVRLTVIDTGEGIPPENFDRIFDPFFTTKEVGQGSGLGLAMVYGAVQSLGGFITFHSEVGRGSQFDLWLPVAAAPQPETTSIPRESFDPSGTETVLVVDDEPHILELVEACLPPHGYRVVTASNGAAALETLAQKRAEIDLALLDLLMPGMDGKELWRRMKEAGAQFPVLFTSGYGGDDFIAAKNLEGYNFLRKPYSIDELLYAVRKTLDKQTVQIY